MCSFNFIHSHFIKFHSSHSFGNSIKFKFAKLSWARSRLSRPSKVVWSYMLHQRRIVVRVINFQNYFLSWNRLAHHFGKLWKYFEISMIETTWWNGIDFEHAKQCFWSTSQNIGNPLVYAPTSLRRRICVSGGINSSPIHYRNLVHFVLLQQPIKLQQRIVTDFDEQWQKLTNIVDKTWQNLTNSHDFRDFLHFDNLTRQFVILGDEQIFVSISALKETTSCTGTLIKSY